MGTRCDEKALHPRVDGGLMIVGGIPDVKGFLWSGSEFPQGVLGDSGIRFFPFRILGSKGEGKVFGEIKMIAGGSGMRAVLIGQYCRLQAFVFTEFEDLHGTGKGHQSVEHLLFEDRPEDSDGFLGSLGTDQFDHGRLGCASDGSFDFRVAWCREPHLGENPYKGSVNGCKLIDECSIEVKQDCSYWHCTQGINGL